MTHDSTEVSVGEDGQASRDENPALKVPVQAVVDYLNRIDKDGKCTFCHVGDYGVIPSPSGGTASVVAAPVPNVQHLGVWFFVATCMNCGHTIFFNARHVLAAMRNGR
jgi:predicted nucleic-acid-binding Zn-ribbon protein